MSPPLGSQSHAHVSVHGPGPLNLAALPSFADGVPAVVAGLSGEPLLRERLVELGFTPGQVVTVLSRGPGGNPLRVRLRGGALALRADEAACVLVVATPRGAARP